MTAGSSPTSGAESETQPPPLVALTLVGAALFATNLGCVEGIQRSWLDLDALIAAHCALAVAFTLWYACFLSAVRSWREVASRTRTLLVATGVAVAVAHLATPPRGSIDALTYVVHGHFQIDTGDDVYAKSPAEALAGPLRDALLAEGYAGVHTTPSPYGPLWSAMEAAVWRLTGDVRAALRAFQLLGLVSLLLCAAALAALLRYRERCGGRRAELAPGAAALALILCPLAPNEAVHDAHLDVTAYAFVLGAFLCASQRRARLLAPLLIAAAVNIKLVFGIYLPALAALTAMGQGVAATVRVGLVQGALVAACTGLAYAPYWHGPETLRPLFTHAGGTALTTPLVLIALALACIGAARLARRAVAEPEARESADATVPATTALTIAYWLPWYGFALVGELLRGGRSGVWIVLYLTLMGRLFTGVYFTAQQHYGARFPWLLDLPLPGHVFQVVSLALVAVGLATWAIRRRASRSTQRYQRSPTPLDR